MSVCVSLDSDGPIPLPLAAGLRTPKVSRSAPGSSHTSPAGAGSPSTAVMNAVLNDLPPSQPLPSETLAEAKKRRQKRSKKPKNTLEDAKPSVNVGAEPAAVAVKTVGSLGQTADPDAVKSKKKKSKKVKSAITVLVGEHPWDEAVDGRPTSISAVDGDGGKPLDDFPRERDGEVNPKLHKLLRDVTASALMDKVRRCCYCLLVRLHSICMSPGRGLGCDTLHCSLFGCTRVDQCTRHVCEDYEVATDHVSIPSATPKICWV